MIFYPELLLHVVSATLKRYWESFLFLSCSCHVVIFYSFVARRGSKFMPKAKLKQLPQKEISASEHATSSKDGENVPVASSATSTKSGGILNECHDAVASTLSTSAEDSIRSNHRPQEELSNSEDATKSASEGLEAGLVTNSIPETNLNNGKLVMLSHCLCL